MTDILVTTSFGPQCSMVLNYAATQLQPHCYVNIVHIEDERVDPKFKKRVMDYFWADRRFKNDLIEISPLPSKKEALLHIINQLKPDVWVTGMRKSQTEHRKTLDGIPFVQHNVLKIMPFFHYTDEQVWEYLWNNGGQVGNDNIPLPCQPYEITFPDNKTECGIHLDYQI